jgi:probable HAF family extracellular repeat protein
MTPLTPLIWGGSTAARPINNLGEIAGDTSSGLQTGFLWRNGATTPIDTLGGSHTWVHGINDLSQVVGASDVPENAQHAFLWDNGAMTDLGTLPGGIFSGANDINNAQVIVGSSETGTCDPTVTVTCRRISHAVLWRDGVMADLNELIVPAPGWVLNSALAINENGEIIGYGTVAGARRSFLVRPLPPPAGRPRPRPAAQAPRALPATPSAPPHRRRQRGADAAAIGACAASDCAVPSVAGKPRRR